MIEKSRWRAVSVAIPTRLARPTVAPVGQALWAWLARYRGVIMVAALLSIAGLAHAINMFHLPYYENDEGTYMAQAWAVVREGRLAPYTYIYDHAPLGWLQIAAWTALTGGFHTFGMVDNSGRVFMLVLQVASTYLVYRIARTVSGSATAAMVAGLLFALSPFAIYYHRRVLLDNITTFWMLLAILLLVAEHLSLRRVWLSALALAFSILSKEVTVFLIPVLAYLVFIRADRARRTFAVVGWIAIVLTVSSEYVLLALLKGEFFPYHVLMPPGATGPIGHGLLAALRWQASLVLGGAHDHVSLMSTLQWQAGRGKDGGIVNPQSKFWQVAAEWVRDDPLLVVGGMACALASVLMIKRHRVIGVLGLTTFALWAFYARGGEVLDFYLVPEIPLLALNIALIMALGLRAVAPGTVAARMLRLGPRGHRGVALAVAALCVAGLAGGYTSPRLGFAADPLTLWDKPQTNAQQRALAWVERHIPPRSSVIIDDYMWADLHATARPYPRAHWYWKVDEDKAIGSGVFHNNWRNIDYIVATPQLLYNTRAEHLTLVAAALAHATRLAHFDTDAWAVDIYQVHNAIWYRAHPRAVSARPPRRRPTRTTRTARTGQMPTDAPALPPGPPPSPTRRRHPTPRYWFNVCMSACPTSARHR